MKNQESQSPKSTGKSSKALLYWLVFSLLTLLVVFLVYYVVMNKLATEKWISDFDAAALEKMANSEIPENSLLSDSAFISLQRQISFTKSRLALTKANPIGLSIYLNDSIATLEVNGVTVHTTDILDFSFSRSLSAINPYLLAQELSSPLKIVSSEATIEKEPIIIKTAPKDTTEAATLATVPDTATNVPVFFKLTFQNGFRMLVLQEDPLQRTFWREQLIFLINQSIPQIRRNLKSILKFQIPSYSPEIRVVLSGAEARTIYRAIPEDGLVSLRLN